MKTVAEIKISCYKLSMLYEFKPTKELLEQLGIAPKESCCQ
ncbi:MAG TPA: hypothetical protein PKE69_16665 [Pyrinomonadaceae bacterium]|nr:hypothetical protein [Pyrinomonadaceae bacterium]